MKVFCVYCGNPMNDFDETCSNCGAVNQNLRRTAPAQPQTIEELKEWYTVHGLPAEDVTRFYIGKNHVGPRAFGIYHDGEKFIVYKNKNDGSRVIRYEGNDEAYAVNELYQKLREEMINQKAVAAGANAGMMAANRSTASGNNYPNYSGRQSSYNYSQNTRYNKSKSAIPLVIGIVLVFWIVMITGIFLSSFTPSVGSNYRSSGAGNNRSHSYYYDDDDDDYDYNYNDSYNSYDSYDSYDDSSWDSWDSDSSWDSDFTDWGSDW